MTSWVSEIVSFSTGVAGSFALLLLEPVRRRLTRWLIARDPSPITVNATSNYASIWSGHPSAWLGQSFYVPNAQLDEPPPGTLLEWPDWIKTQGGGAEDELFVFITLICDLETTVVVRPPTVTVTHHDTAPEATTLRWQPQGGASMMPLVTFDVNLAMRTSMIAADPANRNAPLSWSIAKGEARSFLIRAQSGGTGVYEWSLELPVIVAGKETLQRIDDNGSPFITAKSPANRPNYFWADGQWQRLIPPPLSE